MHLELAIKQFWIIVIIIIKRICKSRRGGKDEELDKDSQRGAADEDGKLWLV